MNTVSMPSIRLSIFTALLWAVFCMASPLQAAAQDQAADTTLRERIKQRVADRRELRQSQEDSSTKAQKILEPGDYVRSIKHDGLTRTYRIHVPKSYQTVKATPLLLAFHGGGGDMDYMANDEYYGLISTSEAEGFVVVFPNGYSRFRSGKLATWNAGSCCANARDENIDDVGFIKKLIASVSRELTIDPKRIYAIGMSNGGMMSYHLACEMSDTFAAIAAVAGTDGTLKCHPAKPISVLHIHAKNDDRVSTLR